ncbi:MAG: ATP-binding protein [Erysipelotrichaceae bacterium]|nr:ATP-binding protein [Erysipelotrichaceae bacterium]
MVGREFEKKELEYYLSTNKAEFLVVYGRRRVGKTYLVKEFFHDSFSFYTTGVANTNKSGQLAVFNRSLIEYGSSKKKVPSDWFEAFERLKELLINSETLSETGRKVVFLDEVPWMDSPRSDFKTALDFFWNTWASRQNDLLLIVCGSATSWIIDNIIKDSGGFYNRITGRLHIKPFTLSECEKLLQSNGVDFTRNQIVRAYMVFGGIPYYLNYLRPRSSLTQNLDNLFFSENAPLRNEFKELFSSLFRKSDDYVRIIRKLSEKKIGMTRKELLEELKMTNSGNFSKYLDELEQCGFLRKYFNNRNKKREAIYQLIDPLTIFCLTFIENKTCDSWQKYANTQAYDVWCGFAFERVCLLHTRQIKEALKIAGIISHEYAWRSKDPTNKAQIDMVIDRDDDVINLCEIKFSKDEYVISGAYAKKLLNRKELFIQETGTRKAVYLTMITSFGLKRNEHSEIIANSLDEEALFL